MIKNHELKIISRDSAASISTTEQKCGAIIGFTSGAFDILHSQHVHFLRMAKSNCDILIVGVNTDKSVKEYKGKDRPILPENERATIIAGIQYTDYVFLFDEPDNSVNLPLLKPNLFIKGGDYFHHKLHENVELIEKPMIEKYNLNTKVILIPTDISISTTAFINKAKVINE